jgi:hypothetical protein
MLRRAGLILVMISAMSSASTASERLQKSDDPFVEACKFVVANDHDVLYVLNAVDGPEILMDRVYVDLEVSDFRTSGKVDIHCFFAMGTKIPTLVSYSFQTYPACSECNPLAWNEDRLREANENIARHSGLTVR